MNETIEQKLATKLEGAKADVKHQLFKLWCNAKTTEEREELHATYRGITLLTRLFTKSINGDNNDG